MPSDLELPGLAWLPVAEVSKSQLGTTLAFRMVFADSARAYFKPEQQLVSHWFSEVASFHLDRLLGLHRVAPVVSRRLPWSTFSAKAADDWRIGRTRIAPDGTVRGALIAWIDLDLLPLHLPEGWEDWLRLEEPPKISPFRLLSQCEWGSSRRRPDARAPAPDTPGRPAELSDLVLFDYLIANLDRWGGCFANLRTLGSGGPLIHLDNANGFEPGRVRSKLMDACLHAVHKFRRGTIEAIRRFELKALRARLSREAAGPVLDDGQLAGLEARRLHLLEHVDEMQRRFGAAAVCW